MEDGEDDMRIKTNVKLQLFVFILCKQHCLRKYKEEPLADMNLPSDRKRWKAEALDCC